MMKSLFLYLILLSIGVLTGALVTRNHRKKKDTSTDENKHTRFSLPSIFSSKWYGADSGTKIEDSGTKIVSTWTLAVLNPKTGSILRSVPIAVGEDEEYTLGRDADCDLTLSDSSVSKVHAVIYCDNKGTNYIRDNDSTNGLVLVSGKQEKRIPEIPLTDGLVCFLGTTPIGFMRSYSRRDVHITEKKRVVSNMGDEYSDNYSFSGTHVREKRMKIGT